MAGGFFSGSSAPQAPRARPDTDGNTAEFSPGGFFRGGADVQADRNAASSASAAVDAARNSKGWAVGNPDDPLTGWSTTNNSMYYSQRASGSANRADSEATLAANSASIANQAAVNATSERQAAQQARQDAITARMAAQTAQAAAEAAERGAQSDSDDAAESARLAGLSQAAAATSATRAAASEQRAAESDSEALLARDAARQARNDAIDARNLAQTYDSEAGAYARRAETAQASASADSDAAALSAANAKSWAVGPSFVGSAGTDTNNARYWAMVARDASDIETVQFDFVWPTAPSFATIEQSTLIINNSSMYIEDPLISYNGVVLSDGDHYTWDTDRIVFNSAVGLTSGDCITVTAGGERDNDRDVMTVLSSNPASPETGQFYFNDSDDTLRIYNGTAWRSITTS